MTDKKISTLSSLSHWYGKYLYKKSMELSEVGFKNAGDLVPQMFKPVVQTFTGDFNDCMSNNENDLIIDFKIRVKFKRFN